MKNILFVIVSLFIISCGGSVVGNENNSKNNIVEPYLEGFFIDQKVVGLRYKTDDFSGYTDENGRFFFKAGSYCSFYIGNILLGKTPCQYLITPYNLAYDFNTSNPSIKTVNIARLLQSLDIDDKDDTITLSKELDKLNFTIDLTQDNEANLESVLKEASDILNRTFILKDKNSSIENLNKYIKEFEGI